MLALLLPLPNDEFLVDDEVVYYDRRFHSASLLASAAELIAALTVLVWWRLDVSLTRSTPAAMLLLASLVVIVGRLRRVKWRSTSTMVLVAWYGLLIWSLRDDVAMLAAVVFVVSFARFGLTWLRWAFYKRLLVTNRRVIQVDGLLGSEVATMPLFRITDALLSRSAVAEILGYASFHIESAGQNQALGSIEFLDDADTFHQLVISLSTTPKEQPGTAGRRDTDPALLADRAL